MGGVFPGTDFADVRARLELPVPAPARRQAARGAAAVHDGADAGAGVAAGVPPRGVRARPGSFAGTRSGVPGAAAVGIWPRGSGSRATGAESQSLREHRAGAVPVKR